MIHQFSRPDIDRFIFIADIHFGVRNASIEWSDNMIDYFDNFFIPLLQNYVKQEKIAVIIAGDFFDNRKHVDINILNIGADVMEKISNICEVFTIIGNHDIYKKQDVDVASVRMFKYFKNVNVIYDLSEIICKDNSKILLVPWMGDHKAETELLGKFKDEDFVVMHTDIAGLAFDNGREILDGANPNVMKKGLIISGHIHKRQESKKVIYLGTPYQLRRSDIGNIKGIYSLIFNNDSHKMEFIENTYSPKFLRLNLLDILDKTFEEIKNIVHNNYVDIIIKKRWMNDINVSKLIEVMDECGTKKIEIILDKNDEEIKDSSIEHSGDISIKDIFDYKLKNYELSDLDKKTLHTMNESYLKLATESLGGEPV